MAEREEIILEEMRLLPLVTALRDSAKESTMTGTGLEASPMCLKTHNAYVQKVSELTGDEVLAALLLDLPEDATNEERMSQVAIAAAQLEAYLQREVGVVMTGPQRGPSYQINPCNIGPIGGGTFQTPLVVHGAWAGKPEEAEKPEEGTAQ